jgi:two-component system, OmpR family, osmolarity sensor histidine kinase EnvZ
LQDGRQRELILKAVTSENVIRPGIPQGERAAVFEPFYRLETSRSRSTGGSGLGLAIAREIVVAHGGQIHVAQSPAGGARLNVELPV